MLASFSCMAKDDKEILLNLIQEDSANIYTIATYPTAVRENIFKACTQPRGIVNLSDIQKKSSKAFQSLLSPYAKDEQDKIWNLTRYENLIDRLATAELSKDGIGKVLAGYPQEVYNDAMHYALAEPALLKNISSLNSGFNKELESLIQTYPPDIKNAFKALLKTPEVISILNQDMFLTVRLGDIYTRDPLLLTQRFEELSVEIAQQKAKDLEEWRQAIAADSGAARELQESAKEYARENGYTGDDYYYTEPTVVEKYVYVPYPYWCGYPWWYNYDYWYPYPYWYHWGFYYWHANIFWVGLPSWHFMHWHFARHHHHHHYPHVTNIYINFYHHHRAAPRNAAVVHTWVKANRNYFPNDFDRNENTRINTIREYGKLEMDYDKYRSENPRQLNRDDYFKTRATDYPHLKLNPGIEPERKALPERKGDNWQPGIKQPDRPLNEQTAPKEKLREPRVQPKGNQPDWNNKPVPRKQEPVAPVTPRQRHEPVKQLPPQQAPQPKVMPQKQAPQPKVMPDRRIQPTPEMPQQKPNIPQQRSNQLKKRG